MLALRCRTPQYFSRGLPPCGGAGAQRQRDFCFRGAVTWSHLLPAVAGYPVLAASSRALWWCQRAAAWCSLRRSDQRSAKASRARVISLAACSSGQDGEPGGLGDGQPDRRDAGRAGLAAAVRDGRVAEGDLQLSGAGAALADGSAHRRRAWLRERSCAGERAPDSGGPELGEGGQCSVPADGLEKPGLGLVPAMQSFPVLNVSSPATLIPVKQKSSLA